MRAGDLMTREVELIHPEAAVEEVALKLEACQTGSLPVCRDGRLLGMISHKDVAGQVPAPWWSFRLVRVRDLLAPEVFYCLEDTDVSEAAALMTENELQCLPVLSTERKFVGILTLASIPSARRPRQRANGARRRAG